LCAAFSEALGDTRHQLQADGPMNHPARPIERTRFNRSAPFRLALLGCLAAVIGCTAPQHRPQRLHPPETRVFQGAWFEISYPAGFTPAPSLASSTAEGVDSAAFISPDGSVSFYVYAPQWGGEPTDIALDPLHETLVSENRAVQNNREIRWLTICAKDGGYCRAYQDTRTQQGSVRTVLGIKYRDEQARQRYLQDYLRFRNSLEQFAD
jgi:hypothetical protein